MLTYEELKEQEYVLVCFKVGEVATWNGDNIVSFQDNDGDEVFNAECDIDLEDLNIVPCTEEIKELIANTGR